MNFKINRKQVTIFLLITLTIFFLIYQREMGSIVLTLQHANLYFLIVAIGCMLVYWLIEAKTLQLMIGEFEPKTKYTTVLKMVMATQFFNGITPFSTGGQPFQIYVMAKKEKMHISQVTSASIHNFIMYQIVLVLMGTVALIYRVMVAPSAVHNNGTTWMIVVGFALNIGVILMLVMVALSPPFAALCLKPILWIHRSLSKPDKHDKMMKNLMDKMKLFHENIWEIVMNPKLFLTTFLLNVFKLLSFYSVVYFVCRTIGFEGMSLIQGIMLSAYVMMMTSMVPIPGASGGAEYGFVALFGAVVGSHIVVIMLLWRFVPIMLVWLLVCSFITLLM